MISSVAVIKRSFAIRRKPEPPQMCLSLQKLNGYAHQTFVEGFDSLKKQIKVSPPGYNITLLETVQRLSGKRSRVKSEFLIDQKRLQEQVFLQLIEDLDDPKVTTPQDLLDIMRFVNNNALDIVELQSLVKDIVAEIEKRAHLYLSAEIALTSGTLQKMIQMRVIEPIHRLDQSVRDKLKQTDINRMIKGENFPRDLKADISFDRRRERLVVRSDGTRYVFQQIGRRNASSLETILETLRQESPDLVMVSMSPFDQEQRLYEEPHEIDQAMFTRLSGKKMFKVGQTERIVYEKIAGLKQVNVLQSLLYNFSSEGAFCDLGIPIKLIGASVEEVNIGADKIDLLSDNIRAQLLLEKLSWTADCIDMKGCPQCSTKQTDSCDGVNPAYLDHISAKLWPDTRIASMARHILKAKEDHPDFETLVIFTHTPIIDLASEVFRQKTNPETDLIANFEALPVDKQYQARALMADLDLEITNPHLKAAVNALHPSWPFDKVSRDCFIESQLIIQ